MPTSAPPNIEPLPDVLQDVMVALHIRTSWHPKRHNTSCKQSPTIHGNHKNIWMHLHFASIKWSQLSTKKNKKKTILFETGTSKPILHKPHQTMVFGHLDPRYPDPLWQAEAAAPWRESQPSENLVGNVYCVYYFHWISGYFKISMTSCVK